MKDFLERLGFTRQTNKTIESTTPQQTAQSMQTRMLALGGLIVFCMLIIIARLFYLQIIEEDNYKVKLANFTRKYEMITTPRGEILDRNDKMIISNKIIKSIVYYPPNFHKNEDKWQLAQKFNENFNTDELVANTSDLTDLYLFLHEKEINKSITDEDLAPYGGDKISRSDYDKVRKNKVSDDDRKTLSEDQIKSYKVYQQMTKSTSGGMKMVLSDASNNDIAYLAENILEYPGFESFSNWDRDYLESYGLRGVIGSVSTEAQGLSSETVDYFLAKDYTRNERMGRSGLEEYYEDLISGDKIVQDVLYNDEGFAYTEEIQAGAKGDNLKLSIDLDLQKAVEDIVIRSIESQKGSPYRKYYDTAYVMLSDPKTGDILSSVAIKTDDEGELFNNAAANHLDAMVPGSVVKGATVYYGLSEGVVSPTEQISDECIKIASTPIKCSYQKNLGSTNAVRALAQSSNVYQFNVAMRIAQASYQYDMPLYGVDESDFNKFKENFSRFGLGTLTGVDVPNEKTGFHGKNYLGGFLLDYSIGQYDTYTPMQLNAYINTIANDGIRVKPRYVTSASDPITGVEVYDNKVEVMSTLTDLKSLAVVQEGFRSCVTEGLCRGSLADAPYTVAAKTGTAEATKTLDDGTVITDAPHSLLIGYAPYENPEVTLTCVAPNSMNTIVQGNICQPIAREVLDYYFNNK